MPSRALSISTQPAVSHALIFGIMLCKLTDSAHRCQVPARIDALAREDLRMVAFYFGQAL
jgi:hypothetical protein